MPKRIYLIRHGETEGSLNGLFVGSLDLPLLPRGVEQVERLAALLPAHLGTATVTDGAPGGVCCVASPLLRAQQSAAAIARRFGLPVVTDPDLREVDFGAWEGLTPAQIEERYPGQLARWASPSEEMGFPGGETIWQFDARVRRALGCILAHPAEVALVVAHGGVVRRLACDLLRAPEGMFWLFAVRPASIVRIDLSDPGPMLCELWSVADREQG